ncbi:MAG: acyl-CoA/acyl-ACP dehydrogenase [Chloroflexi bacterium]|nr:acyl-CoA/acyl-ACP dehydrogenase [Chloroflexota bacterium]
MVATVISAETIETTGNKWLAIAQELGPDFASRAAVHDSEGTFVAENYEALRENKLFSAAVPIELGGGGASHAEICSVVRELAHHDGSTALAFSMHSHLLATLIWRYRRDLTPSSEPVLRKIAAEELVLVSTGGSDWLDGSGSAVKVEGGYRYSGRKVFSSGSPSGHLLLTTGVYDDPEDGPVVLHFAVNLRGDGVTILDDWNTMGMRGTGSNTIILEDVFVPDGGVSLRRPKGIWHPFFDVISPLVWPLVMAAYIGIAESARNTAVSQASSKKNDPLIQEMVGEMDTELLCAQSALERMIGMAAADVSPSVEASNLVYQYKTMAVRGAIQTVEKAISVVGGAAYFRNSGLERCLRDVQAARFHPFQERKQYVFSGRIALGLDPVE